MVPSRPSHCAKIKFLQVRVIEEEHERKESIGQRRFCAEEPLPQDATSFTKHCNNTGYWDDDHLDESLLRFSKFTHDATEGYLMVTDLQGVRKDDVYYLTDPVLLCQDIMRFGYTNLGPKMLTKCINST